MNQSTVPAGSLRPVRTTTQTCTPAGIGAVEVTVSDRDRTTPFLLLHGGGGPATMAGFADLLAARLRARVLLPTHPGFAGTPRPEGLRTVADLARVYADLLDRLDLADVTLVGNSFGGWLAAEIALLGSPRVSGAIVVDAIGAEVPGHPVASVAGLSPTELAALSFHDPSRSPAATAPADGPPAPSPDVQALVGYAGGPAMSDPTLLDRLGDLDLPVHVVWGESDGIVDPAHAHAWADAVPGATLTVLPRTGHLPQVETPEELLGVLRDLGTA